jgi:hypothetical protein
MKRPWDKKVLGTKQSLDKTSSENLRQNIPIFRDRLSVPENKTLHNFFGQNIPDPQKTSTATAPLLLPWQPRPAVRPLQHGPGGVAPGAKPWRHGPSDPTPEARHRRPGPGGPAQQNKQFCMFRIF